MTDGVTLLGVVAGTLTTAAFVPQVVRTWRTRSTRDISLGMFSAFTAGVALWLVYGIFLDEMPIILSNAVTLVLAGIILVFKLLYK
ncbi:MAG: SemiSWEET transporter [Magnetospirillum sp. WYHS-4]